MVFEKRVLRRIFGGNSLVEGSTYEGASGYLLRSFMILNKELRDTY
jgi:hypothetical protein